jgi:hypothetical protein
MSLHLNPREPRPVRARDGEWPIHAYGDLDVLSVSPTYEPLLVLQKRCSSPWKAVRLRKSWEISSNYLGLTPTRLPNSIEPEFAPNAAARMIDGDVRTYGVACVPLGDPAIARAWVRVTLPRPATLSCVRLIPPPDTSPVAAPANFEIRLIDWDLWESEGKHAVVYRAEGGQDHRLPARAPQDPGATAPAAYRPPGPAGPSRGGPLECRFAPARAREVWITSDADFALAEIEAIDAEGRNLARLSSGAGITVSAEPRLFWLDQSTHDALWLMQFDLGIKWLRISYYLSPLIWPFVERQRGVYTVDPHTDRAVSAASENGIEVCLTLGPADHPGESYEEYVRFMVGHFRGRVRYYEILNEFYNQDAFGPNVRGPVEKAVEAYCAVALPAARMIRRTDPGAKIVQCGPCPLAADFILGCLAKGMAEYADVVSWHPYSFSKDTDQDYGPEHLDRPRHPWAPASVRTYADAVVYLRREAAALGFHGELHANECGAYAIHADRTSQLIAAKYLARSAVLHTALRVPMFWNETTSLLRPSWQPFWGHHGQSFTPAYSYYVLRTLCTVLDGAEPCTVRVELHARGEEGIEHHAFRLPSGALLVALWVPARSRARRLDDYEGMVTSITLEAAAPERVIGIDLLNGREQELGFRAGAGVVSVGDLVVRDYPLLLRLEH